jgi:hypothetical protein
MKNLFLLFTLMAFTFGTTESRAQDNTTEAEFILSWDVCPTANTPQYRAEHYSVWISTTGNTPDDFTTMLFEETLSTEHENWVYENRQVNIDDYANLTVYVAFRHHDITDMDRVVIDNVKLYRMDGTKEDVVYLMEDFQDGIGNPQGEDWLPEGWSSIDADGDDFNWYFKEREGEGAMRSQSWEDVGQTPLTPDNYLITPSVFMGTVSVKQLQELIITIFPNPASSVLSVISDVEIQKVEVINTLGAVVLSQNAGAADLRIDISQINPGMYFLRLNAGAETITRKINISR